ncbi:phosphatidylinositol-specific phospholipase C domain-containing protein [Oscillospiraceae bacterium OttesenSCG-928-G22]|nr:phosphatidylinositol-specific phospholipase C domain-containing protein [Oscillospiraceae bacterium OttesenSCG-928-G22]
MNALCGTNWMSFLDQAKKLTAFSIPGTHDSGTENIAPGGGHCQNYSIERQLNDGIRFLDIRLKEYNGNLQLFHGAYDCGVNFHTVLQWCQTFLVEHPTETILMSIKNEESSQDINSALHAHFEAYSGLFLKTTSVPTLDAAKGKIVFFDRCGYSGYCARTESNMIGIDWGGWQDDTAFTMDTGSDQFYVDDNYNTHKTHDKVYKIQSAMQLANEPQNANTFYVIFCSISVGSHTPYQYAWGGTGINPAVNPSVYDFVQSYGCDKRLGVVLLDFYNDGRDNGDKNQLVESIIQANPMPCISEQAPEDGSIYYLLCKHSGKYLDMEGSGQQDDLPAITWRCLYGYNQKFRLECVEESGYRLVALHSKKYLDVPGGEVGNRVVQRAAPSASQLWNIKDAGDGWFMLVHQQTKHYMGIADAGKGDGAPVILCPDNDKDSQQFRLIPVAPVAIFQHGDFGGKSQMLPEGKWGMSELMIGNDALSSLKIAPGYKVTLYEHSDFTGSTQTFTEDTPWVGDGFNDKTSSIVVEKLKEGEK